ncbi:yippee zinc-binding/DNA-binding /Mis18, centromere assembly domain-containing protein [Hirsutella rhossiliensis]|uniref:Yippee zinc-binding/DNA-binding /Mis18, centromere assembly domain-containing protein n=1 Tax=Hirsutella rhossiliensis TaxID=111463 RepID=A0A9P8N8B8_9HYPO|nr:yippee zinc-binding/DNA-binding /Mis18, centromere assembly domain-containing protein [Hirsutella rhossiliensis]KAH0967559.1 yippee zinc-binding/DNA-binding /Mis18, centromere assembly domain-containing protein [Hirsutella rhossiliensis]
MPRDSSRISATRPVFPRYLLPTFAFSLGRRRSASPSSSSHPPPPPPPPPPSPPHRRRWRLSRAAADTLRCINCSTDLALASQIVSKGFTGRYGRAFLVAPPSAPAEDQALVNIRVGRNEDRQLVTGWHVVADICCATCSRKLGWKYVDAKENSQKYKVGKYILEVERVVTHRRWEDVAADDDRGLVDDGLAAEDAGRDGPEIVFDSEDDDECDDIFAGVWDAATVAKRRSQTIAKRVPPTAA